MFALDDSDQIIAMSIEQTTADSTPSLPPTRSLSTFTENRPNPLLTRITERPPFGRRLARSDRVAERDTCRTGRVDLLALPGIMSGLAGYILRSRSPRTAVSDLRWVAGT
jgi:hypothetical protein